MKTQIKLFLKACLNWIETQFKRLPQDKIYHFVAGWIIVTTAYLFVPSWYLLPVLIAGAAVKELVDLLIKETRFDSIDFAVSCAGGLLWFIGLMLFR